MTRSNGFFGSAAKRFYDLFYMKCSTSQSTDALLRHRLLRQRPMLISTTDYDYVIISC